MVLGRRLFHRFWWLYSVLPVFLAVILEPAAPNQQATYGRYVGHMSPLLPWCVAAGRTNGPMDRPCVAQLFLCATSPFLLGHIGPTYRTVVALMSVLAGPASLVITTVAHMGAIHRPYVLRVSRSERRLSL
jgi:hypothetical protein